MEEEEDGDDDAIAGGGEGEPREVGDGDGEGEERIMKRDTRFLALRTQATLVSKKTLAAVTHP